MSAVRCKGFQGGLRKFYYGLAALLLVGPRLVYSQAVERLDLSTPDSQIAAWLFHPASSAEARRPAVVALHGCGGLYSAQGSMSDERPRLGARHADYARLLQEAGYMVLFPDSFQARGFRSICTERQSRVRVTHERVDDTLAALAYLQTLPDVDPTRIYLLGWSNGAITSLNALAKPLARGFAKAVTFYPGCSNLLRSFSWRPQAPVLMLLGGSDDWTAPEPCVQLAKQANQLELTDSRKNPIVAWRVYEGAFHGFDDPASKIRQRTGLASTANGSGVAWVGTHPEARQDAQRRVVEFFR
jgi:dienelactone hydrolase